MRRKIERIVFFAVLLCFSKNYGQHAISSREEIKQYSKHHLKDNHHFSLYLDSETGRPVGFSLPVMVWTSSGLVGFMSAAFEHDDRGAVIVKKSGVQLVRVHGKIYELDKDADKVSFGSHHHPTNAHEVLDLSITKNVLASLLVVILMFIGFGSLARGYKKSAIPEGIGRFLEPLVIYVRDEIARPNIGHPYKKYMSFLLSVFFFIWIANLIGLSPLGFNITGNIAVTICMALFTFVIVQFSGNKNYWKHIFWMPGVPVPMKILLIPIEILGILTKPFSLFIRLFANITAGHTVIMGFIALIYTGREMLGGLGSFSISFLLTLFISIIELLVAFLQAYIFTMLSSLFIGMAVGEEH